ncbi:carboxypeptidase-like regulatory domain-containing protein [Winogradskyella ursingii]|uniref:carboxypeptidase-like regulatory domain-containing protein n=1 Tax=Winogradskyella ursingii TaxID=2686079 RepID=UPI0015C7A8A1|nr:carboxypeptidase-like regulatory domain-containing protein [Winogradskyella ursingii]
MKYLNPFVLTAFAFLSFSLLDNSVPTINNDAADFNTSGYIFTVNVSKINSEYSEIPSAVFRGKLVLTSTKKIGAIGNGIDEHTDQPYSDLFCTDINLKRDELSQPILFSRILNTRGNEGQVAFSLDEYTIYYTRSERDNSANYQLYKADLKKDSYGKWINHTLLNITSEAYSVENPHMSADGQFLYFSSNMEGGFGGFDIYKALVNEDGTLSEPINLGRTINTEEDEKYPHTTKSGKEIFFSSKGHDSQGGFDIFISNNYRNLNYTEPRNLGIKINSIRDDIAFMLLNDEKGVFSSNAGNLGQRFNMYQFNAQAIYQELEGIVVKEDGNVLPNTIVILHDSDGKEVERQLTGRDGTYNFKIRPFEAYHLTTVKAGYRDAMVQFQSDNANSDVAYREVLKLAAKENPGRIKS